MMLENIRLFIKILNVLIKPVYWMSLLICLCACSSPSSRQKMDAARSKSHHNYAVDGMETFWLDYRSPEDKDVRSWEFYYKHCSLSGRKPFYDKADYLCTEPY